MALRLSRLPLVALAFFACLILEPSAFGQTAEPVQPPDCDNLTWEEVAKKALAAVKSTELSRRVLPGGARVEVGLATPWNEKAVYCVRFDNDIRPVAVVSAKKKDDDGMTALTLQIPKVSSKWYRVWGEHRELSLIVYQPDDNGVWNASNAGEPALGVKQQVTVTSAFPGFLGSIAVVVVGYALAVAAFGKVRGRFSVDPVAITSGKGGRASLSKLQIFGFSLIVVYLLANFLLRYGMLTDVSTDVLLLLGISAGGAAGSKVAGVAKKRLSFENWSWLRNRGWLTCYEEGHSLASQAPKARWGDLLKTDGEFDVYSFQLATVSVIVGLSLLMSDSTTLATFSIPQNLLGLLGLSNVVYVGGKAVSPSLGDVDEKVDALRLAEKEWITAVFGVVRGVEGQNNKLQAAITAATDKYQTYITLASEAARMVQTVFGREGTKFKGADIQVAELIPVFP